MHSTLLWTPRRIRSQQALCSLHTYISILPASGSLFLCCYAERRSLVWREVWTNRPEAIPLLLSLPQPQQLLFPYSLSLSPSALSNNAQGDSSEFALDLLPSSTILWLGFSIHGNVVRAWSSLCSQFWQIDQTGHVMVQSNVFHFFFFDSRQHSDRKPMSKFMGSIKWGNAEQPWRGGDIIPPYNLNIFWTTWSWSIG